MPSLETILEEDRGGSVSILPQAQSSAPSSPFSGAHDVDGRGQMPDFSDFLEEHQSQGSAPTPGPLQPVDEDAEEEVEDQPASTPHMGETSLAPLDAEDGVSSDADGEVSSSAVANAKAGGTKKRSSRYHAPPSTRTLRDRRQELEEEPPAKKPRR